MAKQPDFFLPNWSRNDYEWAVDIIKGHFEKGLAGISNAKFLDQRYKDFELKQDPIYADLLEGMNDEPLAKTFVSYWIVAQTLATQSRFWLEDAVGDLIRFQAENGKRPGAEVYTQHTVARRFPSKRLEYPAFFGKEAEYLGDNASWRAEIHQSALTTIDTLVGEQERVGRPVRKPFQRRPWSPVNDAKARKLDQQHLAQVVGSAHSGPLEPTTLRCNLLLIQPDKADGKPRVWAIRFINPKTFAQHPVRKQERVNLLRLYAFLIQKKLAAPASITACVAALVPRKKGREWEDTYPDYFSFDTSWSNQQLWDFIGVPFDIVGIAIREAAVSFRKQLKEGLRHLLPGTGGPGQGQRS
jgi:hypothetical protein